MPGVGSPLPPLSEAISQAAVEATEHAYPADEVRKALLDITSDLIAIQVQSTLLGILDPDPYVPSLQTLHMRLETGYLSPSPLTAHTSEEDRVRESLGKRTGKPPLMRPLEDYEDLYYALLAQIKNMHHSINTRITNGFNSPSTPLFPSGLTIATFHNWLLEQWAILNSASLVAALDKAIRRSRVKHLHQELLSNLQAGQLTRQDADELLADLYDPEEYEGMQGLSWIGDWSCAMIVVWLEEKYRVVLRIEKEEAAKNARRERKRKRIDRSHAEKWTKDLQIESVKRQSLDVMGLGAARAHNDFELAMQRQQEDIAIQRQGQQQEKTRQEQEKTRQEQEQLQIQHMQHPQSSEWQIRMSTMSSYSHHKTALVSNYSQYLRGLASEDARRLMDQTNHNVRQSFYEAAVQDTGPPNARSLVNQSNHNVQQSYHGTTGYEQGVNHTDQTYYTERANIHDDGARQYGYNVQPGHHGVQVQGTQGGLVDINAAKAQPGAHSNPDPTQDPPWIDQTAYNALHGFQNVPGQGRTAEHQMNLSVLQGLFVHQRDAQAVSSEDTEMDMGDDS